jgi:hypothetical protein
MARDPAATLQPYKPFVWRKVKIQHHHRPGNIPLFPVGRPPAFAGPRHEVPKHAPPFEFLLSYIESLRPRAPTSWTLRYAKRFFDDCAEAFQFLYEGKHLGVYASNQPIRRTQDSFSRTVI